MTEPLIKISPAKETDKKKSIESRLKHEKNSEHTNEVEKDSVDISEEARERAAGKKHRNILEYINEVPE